MSDLGLGASQVTGGKQCFSARKRVRGIRRGHQIPILATHDEIMESHDREFQENGNAGLLRAGIRLSNKDCLLDLGKGFFIYGRVDIRDIYGFFRPFI